MSRQASSRPQTPAKAPTHTAGLLSGWTDQCQRDAREIEEQDRALRCHRKARAVESIGIETRIMALVEQRIAATRVEFAAEQAAIRSDLQDVPAACSLAVENMGKALDDLEAVASQPAKLANEHMQAMFARLEQKIDEIAARVRRKPIDLPPLPLRSVN